METRINANKLLEMARPQVDALILDAALERGRTLELATVIEQLMAELS